MMLHQEREKQEVGVAHPNSDIYFPSSQEKSHVPARAILRHLPRTSSSFSMCLFLSAGCGDGSDYPRLKQLGNKLGPSQLDVPTPCLHLESKGNPFIS